MAEEYAEMHTLQDVGTRYAHYTDLRDLWEAGLDIASRNRGSFTPPATEAEIKQLEDAIFLVKKQLDVLSKYTYKSWSIRQMVDEGIKDGQEMVEKHNGINRDTN